MAMWNSIGEYDGENHLIGTLVLVCGLIDTYRTKKIKSTRKKKQRSCSYLLGVVHILSRKNKRIGRLIPIFYSIQTTLSR